MFRTLAVISVIALIAFAAPLRAQDEPEWRYRGLAGTQLNTAVYMLGDLYVGAEDGVHVLESDDHSWRDLTGEGVAGWPVTALGRSPFFPDHIITGRVDMEDRGAIVLTQVSDGTSELRVGEQPGPFTTVDIRGNRTGYQVWACVPGGEQSGAVLSSDDGGTSWDEVTGHGHTSPSSFVPSLALVDGDFVDFTVLGGEDDMVATIDDGVNWQPFSAGLPETMVHDLFTACPSIPDLDKTTHSCHWYFAATDAGLYFKDDINEPWEQVLDEPCRRIVFLAGHQEGRAVVLTADRRLLSCFVTTEFVWNWEDWAADLDTVEITDIAIQHSRRTITTADDGLFEWIIPPPPLDVPGADARLQLAAAPNPFNPATTLSFTAPRGGHARLAVHDLRGRRVATLLERQVEAGPVSVVWRPGKLTSGVYLARLVMADETATVRLVLVR